MNDQDPSQQDAERRLRQIAAESEKQQEAKVNHWLQLAKQILGNDGLESDEAVESPAEDDMVTGKESA